MATETAEREAQTAQRESMATAQTAGPAGARAAQSAAEISRSAKKKSLRRMPIVVIVTLVVALGAGTAVGGPVLYDKLIVPSLYDVIRLEVGEDIPASTAPGYKETLGITDVAALEELPYEDAASLEELAELSGSSLDNLINVVRPGHEDGVVLEGCSWQIVGDAKPLITTWGPARQSYSGVYIYVGQGQDSELLAGTPKDIEVYADGKLVGTATLNESEESTYQRVEFSRPVDGSTLSIRVLSSYPGKIDSEFYGEDSFDLAQVTPY